MQTKHTRHLSPLLLLPLLLLSGLLPGVSGLPGLGSVAWAEIRQPVAQLSLWNRGECTRINDSSFSVPDTARNVAIYRPGVPMRYGDTIGTWRYGLITAVADAGETLTVTMDNAARMETTHDGFCEYGSETLLRFESYTIPGTFADADDSKLLLHDLKMIVPPHCGKTRYLIYACFRSISDDTGEFQPTANIMVNGKHAVSRTVTDSEWSCAGAYGNESYYDLLNKETWEVKINATGTNDDSSDLTVQLVWLQEE